MEEMSIYTIKSSCSKKETGKEETAKKETSKEDEVDDFAREAMRSEGYKAYVEKHGYHFTDELAVSASRNMVNADGKAHMWEPAQVQASVYSLGIPFKNRNNCTRGDLCYLANMAYADGLYEGMDGMEKECVKYAVKIADDVDGYEGMPFMRWLSDTIGKNIHVEWSKFL